jgi:hypothetical protein
VYVFVECGDRRHPLPDSEALAVGGVGFQWGYGGGGPNALAASILADATDGLLTLPADLVLEFRRAYVECLSGDDDLHLSRHDVLQWLVGKGYGQPWIDAEARAAEARRRKYGRSLDQLTGIAERINSLPEGRLLAQRFDLVPSDFEAALVLDLMQWIERGGYALRCDHCGQAISCDGSAHSNRLRGQWKSGRKVYHEHCAQEAGRLRKARAWHKRAQDPTFREAERQRAKKNRRYSDPVVDPAQHR